MLSIFSKLRGGKIKPTHKSAKEAFNILKVESLEDRSVPATFWVATTGSDSNPGTQDLPFKTIAFALDTTEQAAGSDQINIFPGAYSESMADRPANPTLVGNTDTLNYGLYVSPTNPVTLQGVDGSGNPITAASNVAATITAGIALNVANEPSYNVSNFAIYAANSVINGLKFTGAAITNSTAASYDLITIYGNNITVSNNFIDSGVVDPSALDQPFGSNGSGITVSDPSFTADTTLSSITGYNITKNTIKGGILLTHGAGIGATASNMVITGNTISGGFNANVAVIGNLGDPQGNPYYLFDAAIPTLGGVGPLKNTFVASASDLPWRQFTYFYGNANSGMSKAQLDALTSGNTLGDYTFATDGNGNPQRSGNSATGGNPGDNNFFAFSIYNTVTSQGGVVTDNPSNAASNWPIRAGNNVNYQVSTPGTGMVTLSDLIFTPQGNTNGDYKLVMGTTPGVGDVRTLTLRGSLAANVDGNGAGNTITGNDGPNTLKGFAGKDNLNGGAGNDILVPGSGNDTVNGGSGIDTAVVNGNFSDFNITYNSSPKTFTLKDLRPNSPEGDDTFNNVEYLQFNNTLVTCVNPGTSFDTISLGLAGTSTGGIIFIGSGEYPEAITINQDVTLIGFNRVVVQSATIGGNARLGSSTVNVQVKTVNITQVDGTRSRPTDAVLISINALGYSTASTINLFGDPNAGTNQGKSGDFNTGMNLYRRVKLVGTLSGSNRTIVGANPAPSGNVRYTSLIAGQPAPLALTFRNGINLSSTKPPAPVPPNDGVYQLPNYN